MADVLSGVLGGDDEEQLLPAGARPMESSEEEDDAWPGVLREAVKVVGASGEPDVAWLVGAAMVCRLRS